jgi:hypothetical protein
MANRAYLLAVEDKTTTVSKDPEREIIAEGVNEVPVFWASLFLPEDRVIDGYDKSDGGKLEVPNWCVRSELAKERLARLEEPIAGFLDQKSRGIWKQWVQHLATVKASFIKTNAVEVWSLDPKGYDKYWSELLKLFAEPSVDHLAVAAEANDMEFNKEKQAIHWKESEMIACKLAGAEHIADVPWLQDLPPPDPPSAADLERKRQYDAVMKQAEQLAGSELRKAKMIRAAIGLGLLIVLGLIIWYFVKR